MKFLFFLALTVPTLVFGQSLSKINADIRCEEEGGGIAIKVNNATPNKSKIWQTDVGDDMGLVLKVKKFKVLSCSDCYDFEASFGEHLGDEVAVRGKVRDMKLTYQVYTPMTDIWMDLMTDVPCIKE